MEMDYPFGYVKTDENFNIIFANEKFINNFFVKDANKFSDVFPEYSFDKDEQILSFNDLEYTLYTQKNENDFSIFILPCVKTVNNTIISLIFIDNYYEVVDSVDDVSQPMLLALIDKKINAYASSIEGIVRKFEKDKYIFIFKEDKLPLLKENKFDILEQVRQLELGNKQPITLSIGIGKGESLVSQMEYARAAIDLALSRGGDQVIIKDDTEYKFFGGNSKEKGQNTRVRARVKAYALTELMLQSSNVIIMGHKNPDLDSIGSAIGIFKIAHILNKKCYIVLNEVTSAIERFYKRIIQDKKYTNVFITNETADRLFTKRTLVVGVDCHRPNMFENPEIIEKSKNLVIFDHHRKSVDFPDKAVLIYHEPFASSTCELITEMLLYINKQVKLTDTEADGLLAGITVDTKNFSFKTGTKTFEAAAYLKRQGADTVRVKMFFQNSLENFSLKAISVENAQMYNGNMAISIIQDDIDNPILLAAQTSDELLNIEGVEASFALCRLGNNVNISARSLANINVQIIMEKLGGGGHQNVSATTIINTDIDSALYDLKQAIDEYIQEV